MNRLMRGNRFAFTLIEALVAIAIIAAVLPVVMSGISLATRAASLSKQRNLATTLGEAKLNELVATGTWQNSALSGDFGDDAPGFTWTANVTPFVEANLSAQNVQQIDLTVTWKSRSATRDITLSTLVYLPSATDTSGTSTGGTQ